MARTSDHAWTVPAHRALCLPDGQSVAIESRRRVAIRCLYFDTDLGAVGHEVRAVTLGPLTRELTTYAVTTAPSPLRMPADQALVTLLTDLLAGEPEQPLHLPLPRDPAAASLAEAVMAEPAAPLNRHLPGAGASRRTLERRFKAETRMSVGQWRRRARVLAAVSMLADGVDVTGVATAVGYSSPSSFVAAFRSELNHPPRRFMDHSASANPPSAGHG